MLEADVPGLPTPKEVYGRIVERFQPSLVPLGYSLGKLRGFPWWYAEKTDGRVFLSAQVDTKATDPYAGGAFRVELEKGTGNVPNAKLTGRAFFFQLLEDDELSTLVAQQNRLIGSLPSPPAAQVNAYPEFLRPQYLSYFQPQDTLCGQVLDAL